ncbi:uncharacterized protein LOC116182608 [Photinus pyralis]|uniref:uncharacterized protein LOC116182608 n=1 Tax=Photinus pyralis TaxID=7054 RepID=UPI0012676F59|nr:uncharacterized protein LOC116182608 [Photinus pyralis]
MCRRRGLKANKAYVCVFVCNATKAVHLEVVSDLSAEAFIAAFRRFVARRGCVSHVYSDNATNFVGAHNIFIKNARLAAQELEIQWHFSPPSGPHFNGLAEAGVKSIKTHLLRVVGEQRLSLEEFSTLLCQIESLLNSRPICSHSTDPNDVSSLTPGHFLTIDPLNSIPDPDISHLKLNTLNRWQFLQRLHAEFWKRWHVEYLNTLQQRSKWLDPGNPIKLNTLVLIKDDCKPPLQWSLGRVIALHPGEDGHVRVVTVKTAKGILRRPIGKLCPLPIN